MADNIAGDKILAHIDRIAGNQRPITADIFLTNFCNNRCPYCTYGRWKLDEGVQNMTFDQFVLYARRMWELGVQGFILTGGGEPTVNPYFEQITGWLEERGLHYGVNTNFNKLVRIRPDYLKISLDGWDEESYFRARGVHAYQKVRENILTYAEWKWKNSPQTSLGIQCLATSTETVYAFYEANRDLPVDYISIRPMESTGGRYYLDEQNLRTAKEIVRVIRRIGKTDSRVILNFKWDMLTESLTSCSANWAQLAVNEQGQVMYCCHKPYQIVGHILDADILEKKRKAGTDLSMCDIPCRLTAPNRMVENIFRPRKDAWFI